MAVRKSQLLIAAAALLFVSAHAQTTSIPQPPPPPQAQPAPAAQQPDKKLTPEQRRQLEKDVHEILRFSSADTGLPIKSEVKLRLVGRDDVERDLRKKMKEDKGAQKLERSAIVLKKFGLLDQSFDLEPFLIALLKEQIAGYYDDKKKNITLLDWISPEDQRSVMAHELTHALQDQHIDLEKFEKAIDDDKPSRDVKEDNRRLAVDERDTARDAVVEGQAMIPLLDYELKDKGLSVEKTPQVVDIAAQNMGADSDSPVMARAPLLLQESLTFPYREGLVFESAVLQKRGKAGAFAGTLDAPPDVTSQIMHPELYMDGTPQPLAHMPDVHPLLDANYAPYDLGAMGEFDVRVLLDLFASEDVAKQLTAAWDGGVYYAAQRRSDLATPDKDKSSSIALLYFSQWKTPDAARKFASAYRAILERKYGKVTPVPAAKDAADTGFTESGFQTSQGFAMVAVSGMSVFTSEGYTPEEARKLEVMFGATSSAGAQTAHVSAPPQELSAGLRHWFASSGTMRAALHFTR